MVFKLQVTQIGQVLTGTLIIINLTGQCQSFEIGIFSIFTLAIAKSEIAKVTVIFCYFFFVVQPTGEIKSLSKVFTGLLLVPPTHIEFTQKPQVNDNLLRVIKSSGVFQSLFVVVLLLGAFLFFHIDIRENTAIRTSISVVFNFLRNCQGF